MIPVERVRALSKRTRRSTSGDDFEPLAATFDRVAESFRSDPNIPPTSTVPASTTTTAR